MKGFLKKWMIEYIEIMLCVINLCCKDLSIFPAIFTLANNEIKKSRIKVGFQFTSKFTI